MEIDKMSDDLNMCTLSGRIVKDPEIRTTPNGGCVTDVTIASNRWVTSRPVEGQTPAESKRVTTYVKVTFWNKMAEKWGEYLRKGDKILVIGKLTDDNYKLKDSDQMTRGRLKLDHIESIAVLEEAKEDKKDEEEGLPQE